VQQRVAVAVADGVDVAREVDATEAQRSAGGEAVEIVAESDAPLGLRRATGEELLREGEVGRHGDLHVPGLPFDEDDARASRFDDGRVVGDRGAARRVRVRALEQLAPEALRRLDSAGRRARRS
jgi:hypothetical protein